MTGTETKIIQNNLVLELSLDRIEATLIIQNHGNAPVPEFNYITDFLKKYNITSTLLENELQGMLDEKIYNTPVCIARGKKCKPSRNGEIIYLFNDPSKRPEPDADEYVDHRARTTIKTVSKGETVAKIIPPIQGEDGLTVTGEIIPAGNPVEKKMPTGRNVAADSDNKDLLIALINGSVNVVSETKINIDPILSIPGNVDYSVGNIDFTGSLIINGDIVSGFTVKVTGSIDVKGVIEDSEVYAGGDIHAVGCAGRLKNTISAGGEINIRYAENSIIQAGMDINVDEYLMNCSVHADGNIHVTKKTGLIAGGETTAFHAVEANTLGNIEGTKTVISVGFSSELKQQFRLIDQEQTRNINKLGDINNALKKLNRLIMIKKLVSEKMQTQIRVLLKMKETVEDQISSLLERHVELVKKLSQTETAAVRISGVCHPGVTINFPDKQLINKEAMSHVTLKLEDDVIIINPMLNEKK
jgi:uncharacterized protein